MCSCSTESRHFCKLFYRVHGRKSAGTEMTADFSKIARYFVITARVNLHDPDCKFYFQSINSLKQQHNDTK